MPFMIGKIDKGLKVALEKVKHLCPCLCLYHIKKTDILVDDYNYFARSILDIETCEGKGVVSTISARFTYFLPNLTRL